VTSLARHLYCVVYCRPQRFCPSRSPLSLHCAAGASSYILVLLGHHVISSWAAFLLPILRVDLGLKGCISLLGFSVSLVDFPSPPPPAIPSRAAVLHEPPAPSVFPVRTFLHPLVRVVSGLGGRLPPRVLCPPGVPHPPSPSILSRVAVRSELSATSVFPRQTFRPLTVYPDSSGPV
jgi:hypothetical protein